uniref:Uncharacterized protein n=1 Tax=Panagrolaimus sp. JU765 TaxID=591449 RepID=A0AC34QU36_9BILA
MRFFVKLNVGSVSFACNLFKMSTDREELQQAKHKVKLLEKQIKDNFDAYSELEEKRDAKIDQLEDEIKQLNKKLREKDKELEFYKLSSNDSDVNTEYSYIPCALSPKKVPSLMNATLNDQIYDLQEDLEKANGKIKELEKDIKDIRRLYVESQEKAKVLEEEIENWKGLLEHKTRECDRLTAENEGYIRSINSMRKDIDDLQQQLLPEAATQGNSIYAELDILRKQAEEKALEFLGEVKVLRQQLKQKDAQLSKSTWGFNGEKLQNELDWQRSYNETLCKINTEMERDVREAQNKCIELKQYLVKKYSDEEGYKDLTKLYELSENHVILLTERNASYQKQLREKMVELQGAVELKNTITILEHKVSELTMEIARMRAQDPNMTGFKVQIEKPKLLPSAKLAQKNPIEEPKPTRKDPFFFRPKKQ